MSVAEPRHRPAAGPQDVLLRLVLGAVGIGFAGWGGWKILTTVDPRQLWPVVRWALGGIVVHDALVAPAAVVMGLLVFPRVRRTARPWLRTVLLGTGCVVLLALVVAGARTQQQNPTAVPTSPWLGLAGGLVTLAVGLALAALAGRLMRRLRRGRRPPAA